jgi:hypothetical protein
VFNVPPFDIEWFEEQWRDNEDFKVAFLGSPTDLEAATFDVALTAVENFENEWVQTLD